MTLYPFALTIHLICAIIFVGYLFFDVIIYPNVKKCLGEEIESKVTEAILVRGRRIMPSCVLLLLLTGLYMLSNYISVVSFFDTTFQKLLLLKVFFAGIIILAVATSLSCAFIFKCKNPLGKIIHPLALTLSFFIILLAKFMFYC